MIAHLHDVCQAHGLRLHLALLGPTGHRARGDPMWPHGSLSLRVLAGDDVVIGRCQSDPGLESVDQLADQVIDGLRRKGLPV